MAINRAYTRRIRKALDSADDSAHALGVAWYPQALAICQDVASQSDVSVERCAIAMAHLSPQISWSVNVRALYALVLEDRRESSVMGASFGRARVALTADDPWGTFGRRANKTRNFARNILGDVSAVTVDTWIARVVGVDDERAPFDRPRVYQDIADAYRAVAKRTEYTPRELQAITWISARGRAA